MLHFVGSFSLGNTAANIGQGGKLNSHLMASCQKYSYQKLSKTILCPKCSGP